MLQLYIMDQNKSIDGLSPRRSKKATVSAPKTTTKKLPAKPANPAKSTKITVTKPVQTTPTPKPSTPKKPTAKTVKPAPVAKVQTTTTEDFLKPVQAFNFDEKSGELKAAKEPIAPPSQQKKKAKKPTRKRKIITRIIIIIISLAIIAIIAFILYINGVIAKITNNQGNFFDFFTETYVPLKTDKNGRTNILAFGTSGYDMEGTEGEGTHDGAQLTDSIMIISLNQETGDVAMLSLPRDLKVSSTCTSTGKINEVYWCNNPEGNDEEAGAKALMDEVNDILDIDFQYYVHLNWGSLVQIVDTLGGINVTLDEDVHDYYIFDAGVEYTLNGEDALRLARTRYGTAHGDFSRSASQQKILIAIKDKIFENNLSLPDIVNLANTLSDNLRISFSVDEIKTLAHLTSSFNFDNMRQVSLIEPENFMATATINGISYVIPLAGEGNYENIQEYVAKMFDNDPKVYEDPSILVLNATEAPGLASNEQASLEQEGYLDVYADDAPAGQYGEGYTIYDFTNKKPGTKKLLEEKYQTTTRSVEELPADIPHEYDFVIIINQVPENTESDNN